MMMQRLIPNKSSSKSTSGGKLQTPPSSPPPQEEPKIEVKTMGTTAMTDNMTIGMEQIVVSASLLLISLYYLARPASKLKWRTFIKNLCGGRLVDKNNKDSSNNGNGGTDNETGLKRRNTIAHIPGDTNAHTSTHANGNFDADSYISSNKHRSKQLNVRFSPIDSPPPPSPLPQFEQSMPSPLRKVQSTPFINTDTSRSLGKGDWQTGSFSTTSTTYTKGKTASNSTPLTHCNIPTNTSTTITTTTNNNNPVLLSSPSHQHHNHLQPQDLGHEHFLKYYETHIKTSSYRKLVLPPQCRLIDPAKMRMAQKKQETQRQLYNLLDNLQRIWKFDYMGMIFHFNYRIWMALVTRLYKAMGWKWEDTEKEDSMTERDDDDDGNDDGTVESAKSLGSSCVGFSSNTNNNGTMVGESPPRPESRDRFYSTIGTTSADGGEDFRDTSSLAFPDWEDENPIHSQAPLGASKEDSHQQEEDKIHGDEVPDLDLVCSAHSTLSQTCKELGKHDTVNDKEVSGVGNKTKIMPIMHRTLYPTTPQRPPLPKQPGTNKVRDHLEKYRRGGAGNNQINNISSSSVASNTGSSISSNFGNAIKSVPTPVSLSMNTAPSIVSIHPTPETPPVSNIEGLNSTEFYFDAAANNPDQEGYILADELLADSRDTPLLVFVNTRSGSQQGLMLKEQLRQLLNPIQVWDLADGGPEKVLESFSVLTHLRILVCGGDGTVSWIISALDKMQIKRWPPIAILPLGTGNDLARIHGWGTGYANESLLLILNQVQEAYISLLDRWKMAIEVKKKKRSVKAFTNYMSIGMDALSALQLHNLRENSPKLFFSRTVNKIWYTIYGLDDAIKSSCSDLPQQVKIVADGVEVPIPDDSQGLIILNIDSYVGGCPLWSRGVPVYNTHARRLQRRRYSDSDFSVYESESTAFPLKKEGAGSFDGADSVTGDSKNKDDIQSIAENFSTVPNLDVDEIEKQEKLGRITSCLMPSSCQDGRLDVVSIRGNFHLGQIKLGLSKAQLLCQCSKLKVILKKKTAVQVDGEPYLQDKGVLRISRKKDSAIMLHRATEEGGGVETEVAKLLDWAEESQIINHEAHGTLMREFSRRIESTTRARRLKSQRTVFSSMATLSNYNSDG